MSDIKTGEVEREDNPIHPFVHKQQGRGTDGSYLYWPVNTLTLAFSAIWRQGNEVWVVEKEKQLQQSRWVDLLHFNWAKDTKLFLSLELI